MAIARSVEVTAGTALRAETAVPAPADLPAAPADRVEMAPRAAVLVVVTIAGLTVAASKNDGNPRRRRSS